MGRAEIIGSPPVEAEMITVTVVGVGQDVVGIDLVLPAEQLGNSMSAAIPSS